MKLSRVCILEFLISILSSNACISVALEEHAANAAKTERHLSPGEVDFVRKCIEKYGDNYVKMARDIKLNYLQLTPVQIEKKCQKYNLADQQ